MLIVKNTLRPLREALRALREIKNGSRGDRREENTQRTQRKKDVNYFKPTLRAKERMNDGK